jgi:Amt family ammonium transporter
MSGTYVNHPEYASYNWTGAPANYDLTTNTEEGGDSSKTPSSNFNTAVLKLITFPIGYENLNKWFQSGDQAYIIVASAMVLVMVPGLGYLYSGLARRKSALSMMWACMGAGSIITFQWYLWGYSLAFSPTGKSGFIGDLKRFGLLNTLGNPSPGSPLIPSLLYAFYQVSTSTA